MSLEVTVKSAANLPNVERFGKSDPFAVLVYQGEAAELVQINTGHYLIFFLALFSGVKNKTEVIDNNLNPEWNQVCQIHAGLLLTTFTFVTLDIAMAITNCTRTK